MVALWLREQAFILILPLIKSDIYILHKQMLQLHIHPIHAGCFWGLCAAQPFYPCGSATQPLPQ